MADRYPLIVDADNFNIKELAPGDNLSLDSCGIVGATSIAAQTITLSGDFTGGLADATTAVTQAPGNNTTKIATTQYVVSMTQAGGYYTGIHFDSDFNARTTSDLTEGTNLYYTTARADSDFDVRFLTKSTTLLPEGSNLYYTTARSDSDSRLALSAGTGISYDNTTGVITNTVSGGEGGGGSESFHPFLLIGA